MNAPGGTRSDRWTGCASDHLHWGTHGGAGLLLRYVRAQGKDLYLLVQRSRCVDHGGTWGIPGGALHEGETAESGARREAGEEIWPVPRHRIWGVETQDCGGGWQFKIVRAEVERPRTVHAARETDATGWFALDEMEMLNLHPGFREWVEAQRQIDADRNRRPRNGD
jgi:8-oxo-dGTP pyrophosphatase MutT (NUDIX family)